MSPETTKSDSASVAQKAPIAEVLANLKDFNPHLYPEHNIEMQVIYIWSLAQDGVEEAQQQYGMYRSRVN